MEMYAPFAYFVDFVTLYLKALIRNQDMFWRYQLVMESNIVRYEVLWHLRNLFQNM